MARRNEYSTPSVPSVDVAAAPDMPVTQSEDSYSSAAALDVLAKALRMAGFVVLSIVLLLLTGVVVNYLI